MTFSDLFLSTLSYIGVATVLLAIGVVLFEVTTKSKELELIRNGKKAGRTRDRLTNRFVLSRGFIDSTFKHDERD